MKKTILLLMLGILPLFAFKSKAQNYKNDGQPYTFFCQLLGKDTLGQLRLTILWDNQREENWLRNEKGEKIEFLNMVDAMNYMSKRGWIYVECVTYDGVNHYLFKKEVRSDEEAKEGLYFKSDFKKK